MDVKKTVTKIKEKIEKTAAYAELNDAAKNVSNIANKIKEDGLKDVVMEYLHEDSIKKDPHFAKKQAIFDKIKEASTIIIHRHVHPDGDALGSSYGLREILRMSFPEKAIYSVGEDTVNYLQFMGSDDKVTEADYIDSLVIVVDTANSKRISGESYNKGKELVKIDHHINVEDYGDINYVREEMPSTASIITDFFNTFKKELKISQEGAMYLYLGTVTDTGRFRYSSVNGDTLRLAGTLLDYNFDTERMYANLNLKDRNSMKLTGYVLNNFKTTKNGVSYIYISKKVQKKFKVSTEEATAQVNVMDSVKGSLIWILFVEFDGIIRARLRSRFIGVNEIAREFNGGGHMQASGASAKNKREMMKMVKLADKELKKFKEENEDVI
ncbi:MAG: bifunctional oligoribonuclease/PAP phosphatase NrnA [Bacilli bacterium]